ncbi:MAG: hypothetical protein LC790_21425 [Actinobacteria bacterium]|nr:hypothetical protein [Actinomycetota bacterium]
MRALASKQSKQTNTSTNTHVRQRDVVADGVKLGVEGHWLAAIPASRIQRSFQ